MNIKKIFYIAMSFALLTNFFISPETSSAKKKYEPEKILYIPHDNRPVVNEQTRAVIEKVGYKIISPPEELLGNREKFGEPDKLWEWLEDNTKKDVRAAIISSDALLYGSLIASRKHDFDGQIILARAEQFRDYRKDHKKLPIYVFGSIMRTPRSAEASGYEEPDYYRNYGANIFRFTALEDKQEMVGLTPREEKEITFLRRLIPDRALNDWKERHKKNFAANERLIDLSRENIFSCLLLGRDDNAPYSQTHMESRYLKKYGATIDKSKFQTIAGIDEVGLMLLTRAANDRSKNSPSVFVKYNWGRGGMTVPLYSDEPLDNSISDEIIAVGARRITDERRADLILTVNTNPNGQTYEATDSLNAATDRDGTKFFADTVQEYLAAGKNVALADTAFANGSDNALMEQLKDRGLLFKLNSYAGWNTATNSTGFALSTGILSKKMTFGDKKNLLTTRYLDDWAYQANVRNIVSAQLDWLRGDGFYGALNDKRFTASSESERLMSHFIKNNLQTANIDENVSVSFVWNRMFEARVTFRQKNS